MEISKLCKNCLGCNREEDPNFLGVEECENCTLNQVIQEYDKKLNGLEMCKKIIGGISQCQMKK